MDYINVRSQKVLKIQKHNFWNTDNSEAATRGAPQKNKAALKNLAMLTGKHPHQSLFNKVAKLRDPNTGAFPCILWNP